MYGAFLLVDSDVFLLRNPIWSRVHKQTGSRINSFRTAIKHSSKEAPAQITAINVMVSCPQCSTYHTPLSTHRIHQDGYNGLVANINDVAKHAGVSPTTAKRAIKDPDKLAPETLKRVQEAIEALQYEPDQLASALRSGQNKTIGLIIGSIVEPFFAHITRSISQNIYQHNYTMLIADSEYKAKLELEHLKQFHGNRVSGVIIRSGYGQPNLDYLLRMQERGTAIVEIDYFYPQSPFSHVMLDNEGAIRQGVRYLASLGHTRIAALGTYHESILPDERSYYFPRIMQEQGLSVREDYLKVIPTTQEEAYNLTHYLMQLPEPPTALFATTGNTGAGAFKALQERGLNIPHDVSLLSFDNYPWTSLVTPQIDVIEQPYKTMGSAAVNIIINTIENKNTTIMRERYPGTLIKRGSSAPPKPE